LTFSYLHTDFNSASAWNFSVTKFMLSVNLDFTLYNAGIRAVAECLAKSKSEETMEQARMVLQVSLNLTLKK